MKISLDKYFLMAIVLYSMTLSMPIDVSSGRIPYNGSIESAKSYAAYKGPLNHHYNNVAVFRLGSMKNAIMLGEKVPSGDYHDFHKRVLASRMTWARHLHYFFMVTGKGESERRVLERSEHCRNISDHYVKLLRGGGRQQVYDCGHGISVLHLPQCNGESWWAEGPCCRCQVWGVGGWQ